MKTIPLMVQTTPWAAKFLRRLTAEGRYSTTVEGTAEEILRSALRDIEWDESRASRDEGKGEG